MEKLKEIAKKPYVWIGLVGIVLLVLFLRARRGVAAGEPVPQPQPQGGGGGGYGGGGGGYQSSPQDTLQQQIGYQQAQLALQTGQQQLDYEKRLQDLQLQGLGSQLEYQQAGQKLKEQYQQGLLPSQISLGQSQLRTQEYEQGAQQHYLQAVQKAQVSCPGTASMRIDPTTGAPYCRQKTSGNILGIPVGSIFRTAQGVAQGAEAYAPQAGYNIAQAGTQFAVRNYLTSPVAPGGAGKPANTGQTGGQGPSYGVTPSRPAPQPYDAGLSAPSPMRQRMV